MKRWLNLLRPGDWLVACGSLAVLGLLLLQPSAGQADTVLIRANGELFRQLNLSHDQTVLVPGPLGDTLVRVAARKVRIERDPGPRQYCVRQSWLERAGQVAVCMPNRTSIELKAKGGGFDTVSY